jgi:hypothetical protein
MSKLSEDLLEVGLRLIQLAQDAKANEARRGRPPVVGSRRRSASTEPSVDVEPNSATEDEIPFPPRADHIPERVTRTRKARQPAADGQ